jgi:hypothetical protein
LVVALEEALWLTGEGEIVVAGVMDVSCPDRDCCVVDGQGL